LYGQLQVANKNKQKKGIPEMFFFPYNLNNQITKIKQQPMKFN
jgi:hypothetical protein